MLPSSAANISQAGHIGAKLSLPAAGRDDRRAIMAQLSPASIAIKCPECGKRALVRKVTSTPELDLTIDLVTTCRHGLQGRQVSECRSMKLIYSQAERRLRAVNSS